MDYVEGCSLADKLAGEPLPEREAASLVQTLARTVHFAHQRLPRCMSAPPTRRRTSWRRSGAGAPVPAAGPGIARPFVVALSA
jgi:hypothetical protein